MYGDWPTESTIVAAYRVLFPCDVEVSGEILSSVDLLEIKKAYRRRAFDTHPDRLPMADDRVRRDSTERFIEISEAYETLSRYLVLRDKGFQPRRNKPAGYEQPRSHPPHYRQRPKPTKRFHDHFGEAFELSYWEREVPLRPLRFGEFLYFSGVIPWSFLIRALLWQRKHRPRLGEIAQRWRWFSESQIIWILKNRRPGELIGEALLRRRVITPFQLNVLLWQQKKIQQPIGEYFIQNGFLTGTEVWRYLQHQEAHNLGFGSDWRPFYNHRTKPQS